MEVPNPKRVLAVSLTVDAAHLSRVMRDLSGSAPATPLAGSTHHVALDTRYYRASVPVWLDLAAAPAEWAAAFLSDEAREVLGALGGLLVVFALPAAGAAAGPARLLLRNVGRLVHERLGGWEWEGVRLAVGVSDAAAADEWDEWDELCAEAGLEFVLVGDGPPPPPQQQQEQQQPAGLGQYGERTGIARVREALEANDWAQADSRPGSDFRDFATGAADAPGPDDPESLDFGLGAADDEVAKLERVMRRLQAVREAGTGMGEAQRRKMAARAVAEAMREL